MVSGIIRAPVRYPLVRVAFLLNDLRFLIEDLPQEWPAKLMERL